MAKVYVATQKKIDEILKDYPGAEPLGSGSFAHVYTLPNDPMLLRMGLITGDAVPTNEYVFIKTLQNHYGRLNKTGVTPRLEFVRADMVTVSKKARQMIVTTRIERLIPVAKFPTWGAKVYGGDLHKIMVALFTAAAKLEAVGLVHPDISDNNILITKEGPKFIDLDEMCDFNTTKRKLSRQGLMSFCAASVGTDDFVLEIQDGQPDEEHQLQKMHFGLTALAMMVCEKQVVTGNLKTVIRKISSPKRSERFASAADILAALGEEDEVFHSVMEEPPTDFVCGKPFKGRLEVTGDLYTVVKSTSFPELVGKYVMLCESSKGEFMYTVNITDRMFIEDSRAYSYKDTDTKLKLVQVEYTSSGSATTEYTSFKHSSKRRPTANVAPPQTKKYKPCKEGYVRHPKTHRCRRSTANKEPTVKPTPQSTKQPQYKPCKEGYVRHPKTHRCRKTK